MSSPKLTPDMLRNPDEFELLTCVSHRNLKAFIVEQVMTGGKHLRAYSVYQALMIVLLAVLMYFAGFAAARGNLLPFRYLGLSLVFSATGLIVIHELIHALAFRMMGISNLKFGAQWKKFIFYVAADCEVVDYRSFRVVALAPLVVVKVLSLAGIVLWWNSPLVFLPASVMAIHSFFCGGDMALMAYYRIHADKEIYSFDEVASKTTWFYYRKTSGQSQASQQATP